MADASIVAAIISGTVGVLGGAFAWRTASHASRLQAESQARVEKIRAEAAVAVEQAKQEGQRVAAALQIALQESAPIERALAETWACLQRVKTAVRERSGSLGSDVDAATALVVLASEARDAISSLYSGLGMLTPPQARGIWHDAKNCIAIFVNAASALTRSDLSADDRMTLRAIVQEQAEVLAAVQDELADARTNLLAVSMDRVSRALRSAT